MLTLTTLSSEKQAIMDNICNLMYINRTVLHNVASEREKNARLPALNQFF